MCQWKKSFYDGSFTIYDGSFTIYDGLFTIYDGSFTISDGSLIIYDGLVTSYDGSFSIYDGLFTHDNPIERTKIAAVSGSLGPPKHGDGEHSPRVLTHSHL